jgi:ABC-type multidrug transport system fused ATPase/permease subunit
VTRIVIAQRLSTMRDADQIYVINNGRIAQSGTFSELGATPGIFSDMLIRQRL